MTALLWPVWATAAVAPAHTPTVRELAPQITRVAHQTGSFDPLLARWQKVYGARAAAPLLEIASNPARAESERYVALVGSARLGGRPQAPRIARFLRDPSWMLRSGALRALASLGDPASAPAVLPLLKDPSLAVRLETVAAVARLRPRGATEALLNTLADPANYQANGKALWVPGRALAALAKIRDAQAAPRLRPLLDHTADPDLIIETVAALETLSGHALKPGAPLAERVGAWKSELALASRSSR